MRGQVEEVEREIPAVSYLRAARVTMSLAGLGDPSCHGDESGAPTSPAAGHRRVRLMPGRGW